MKSSSWARDGAVGYTDRGIVLEKKPGAKKKFSALLYVVQGKQTYLREARLIQEFQINP